MKKFIAILLMGVVLFSGVVGCGSDTGGKDKKPAEKKEKDKG